MSDTLPIITQSEEHSEALSVSAVSLALKKSVEHAFSDIRVRGEIAGMKRHTSGHVYFALKDEHSVMDAVCWRGTSGLDQLREGLEVIAVGKITTYAARSKYQMIVSSFSPTGEGALLQILLNLKEKLKNEGLFDPKHKQKLPPFPRRIGVITSATGAVLRDIMHRLRDRYPCHVVLKPTLVQGQGAAQQVIDAIDMMERLPSDFRPDVLIIARGGGSLEDLFAFNDEALVRRAYACRIPLISAIGHETDFTLLDFVADVRAPTPTAAAEMATPVLREMALKAHDHIGRIHHLMHALMRQYTLRIKPFERLQKDPLSLIQERQQFLDERGERLHLGIQRFMAQKRLKWGNIRLNPPKHIIKMNGVRMQHAGERLTQMMHTIMAHKTEHLTRVEQGLESLSYAKTLKRGFSILSITSPKGDSIARHVHDLPKATHFTVHLHDGSVEALSLGGAADSQNRPSTIQEKNSKRSDKHNCKSEYSQRTLF